jgi:hypothetical protein
LVELQQAREHINVLTLNAVLKKELEKATASLHEEDDIPMKKATNKQISTVIITLSIDCIFHDCIFHNFI